MTWLLPFYALAAGAIIGSFLNVVIYRYPREESIVFPASHCGSCGVPVKPYDNIPVLSYLILGGRCRACRAPFSARYPLVEAANALFYLAIYQRTGPTLAFLPLAAIVSMTIVLIYIDLDIQILPDVIDLPGIALGLGLGALHAGSSLPSLVVAGSLTDSALGALFGGGILLAIALSYQLVRKVEGMGMGDVKMLAMIGSVVGWRGVFAVILTASICGAVIGLAIAAVQRRSDLQFALPFGVFLGLAFLLVVFFGRSLPLLWASFLGLGP
jgi:leader peptidase (prepilin peptidase)/N-methyltransferase